MNKIVLSGIVSRGDISATKVRQELSNMKGAVEVHISSPGGSFFEGVEIFNLLRHHSKTKGKVTTVNTGIVASAGSHIFCAGDVRKAYENSTIMIHNAWNVSIGSSKDMRKTADILSDIDYVQAKIYASITGGSVGASMDQINAETWFVGTDALVKSGLVNEIIKDHRADNQTPKAFYTQSMKEFKAEKVGIYDTSRVAAMVRTCQGNCNLEPDRGNPWAGIIKVQGK